MDLEGNVAIEPRYDQGGEFAEGLAAVQLEGRWMFIDKSGAATSEFPAALPLLNRSPMGSRSFRQIAISPVEVWLCGSKRPVGDQARLDDASLS